MKASLLSVWMSGRTHVAFTWNHILIPPAGVSLPVGPASVLYRKILGDSEISMYQFLLFIYRKTIGFRFFQSIVYPLSLRIPFVGPVLKRAVVRHWLNNEQVLSILNEAIVPAEAQSSFLASLSSSVLVSGSRLSRALASLQNKRIVNTLDPTKKTVAICFSTRAYKGNVGNIPDKLRQKGYNVVTLIGTVSETGKGERENGFLVPGTGLDGIDFADLYICVSVLDSPPRNGKLIYFLHDVQDSAVGSLAANNIEKTSFDYFFLSCPALVKRWEVEIPLARSRLHGKATKKTACIIGGGYPRLDRNIEYFETHREDSKTLVFATTGIKGEQFEGIIPFPYYAERVIGTLLDAFPDYELVFRPHPLTLFEPEIKAVIAKFAGVPRFKLDNDGSSYMPIYAKAALMITDFSGTAYTYSFTTLRPVVFFSHNDTEVLRRFGTYQYFIDREKIGLVARNVDDLVVKVKTLLIQQEQYAASIRACRDASIFNLGKSEDYFVDNIEYILEDKRNPEWIYI